MTIRTLPPAAVSSGHFGHVTSGAVSRLHLPAPVAQKIIVAVEFLAIVAMGLAVDLVNAAVFGRSEPDLSRAFALSFVAAVIHTSLWSLRRDADLRAMPPRRHELLAILTTWAATVALLSMVAFALKIGAEFSRLLVGQFAVAVPLVLFAIRRGARALARSGANGRVIGWNVAVLGEPGELAERNLAARLTPFGIDVIATIPLAPHIQDRPLPVDADIAAIDQLIEACRARPIDEIVLVMPWRDEARIRAIIERLGRLPLPVRLLGDRVIDSFMVSEPQPLANSVAIEVQRAPLSFTERMQKRALDIILASLALVAISPLLAIVALVVRLDSRGPALFKQRRNGFNGREFVIYKFRTMTVTEDGPVVVQATRNDRRITRVGRWLRRTSIDELPQLLNIIRGDMSIVGPRPHAFAHDVEYNRKIANYALRHHMKPGLTGWAQVNGFRGETAAIEAMERRVEHDLWYINNWSFWLDVRIILKTAIALIRTDMAY